VASLVSGGCGEGAHIKACPFLKVVVPSFGGGDFLEESDFFPFLGVNLLFEEFLFQQGMIV